MTPTEVAAKLRAFNEWRRGDEDIPQFDPREIGEAIDAAVEMIDRLEAAEKERNELLASIDEWLNKTKWVQQGINEGTISAKYLGLHRADVMASLLGKAEKERDALRAKIEQMEKQAPVGWLLDGDFYEVRQMSLYKNNEPLPGQTALYALPCAQPAPSAPDDGFKRAVMEIKDIGYGAIFRHLICERAAELKASPEAKP